MQIRRWALCLAAAALLGGCYESSKPLSPPGKVKLDPAVLGKWDCIPDPKGDPKDRAVLTVWPFDDAQYYAEWVEEPNTTRYRAFASRAGGVAILNVLEMKEGRDNLKWVFVRYRVEGDTLQLAVAQDDAVKGADEAAKLEDIRRRAAGGALFGKVAACRRPAGKA